MTMKVMCALALVAIVSADKHLGADKVSRVRMEKASVFDVDKRVANLETTFKTDNLGSIIGKALNDAMDKNQAITNVIEKMANLASDVKAKYVPISQLDSFKKEISDMKSSLASTKTTLEKSVKDSTEQSKKDFTTLSNALTKKMDDSIAATKKLVADSEKKIVADVGKSLQGTDKILSSLKLSYHSNNQIPVYRWQVWDTHHHGISWFDENRPESFGQIHPSQWSDSNAMAYQMGNNFKWLQRLFTNKQTASTYGATVCAITYLMHSSTNGKFCGALFRIRNVSPNTISWRPATSVTSFSGWADRASVSVDGANTWANGGCHNNECHFTPTINCRANGSKNRITTVIFVSASSHPYGGWNGNHERAVELLFKSDSLRLPTNLQYVDDLDTITGAWKN